MSDTNASAWASFWSGLFKFLPETDPRTRRLVITLVFIGFLVILSFTLKQTGIWKSIASISISTIQDDAEQEQSANGQTITFHLEDVHQEVVDVINDWTYITSLDDFEINYVKDIRRNLAPTATYFKFDVEEMSRLRAVVYLHHSSKLFVIHADNEEHPSIKLELIVKAEESINEAIRLVEANDLTTEEQAYLSREKISEKLALTKMNILIFKGLYSHQEENSQDDFEVPAKVQELLKEQGGCDSLKNRSVRHALIYKGTGCPYPSFKEETAP